MIDFFDVSEIFTKSRDTNSILKTFSTYNFNKCVITNDIFYYKNRL